MAYESFGFEDAPDGWSPGDPAPDGSEAAQLTAARMEAALEHAHDGAVAEAAEHLAAHTGDATAAHAASAIANTPAGNVAAGTVQGAINELDTEKQAVSAKGQAGGYASLDGSGKVPSGQLPAALSGSAPEGAFVVFATDDEDVADAHPEFAWIILAPPDTTAPTVPTGLTATPGNTEVVLDWIDSSDDVELAAYRVRRGGTLIASPTTSAYTDTGRTNGVTYSYTVSAVDAAGNESAQCTAATATPTASATLIASDDFNRADASALGSSPVGAKAWTKTGFFAGVSSNALLLVGGDGASEAWATLDAGASDVDVRMKLSAQGATDRLGITARWTDINNYLALRFYGLDEIRLFAFVGGVLDGGAVPTLGVFSHTFTAGDILRLVCKGTSVKGYLNGAQIISVTDTTVPLSNKVGAVALGAGFSAFGDDFEVWTA